MRFKYLLFSMLYAMPMFATTIHYDKDGRPDYEKINESMQEEQREREAKERDSRDRD